MCGHYEIQYVLNPNNNTPATGVQAFRPLSLQATYAAYHYAHAVVEGRDGQCMQFCCWWMCVFVSWLWHSWCNHLKEIR